MMRRYLVSTCGTVCGVMLNSLPILIVYCARSKYRFGLRAARHFTTASKSARSRCLNSSTAHLPIRIAMCETLLHMQQEVRHGCGRERMGRNLVAVGEVWRTLTQGSSCLATLGWRRHEPRTSLTHAVWVCLHAINSRRNKRFSFATRFLNNMRRLPPPSPDVASSGNWRRDFQCPWIAFNVWPAPAPALHLLRPSGQPSGFALNPCGQTVR